MLALPPSLARPVLVRWLGPLLLGALSACVTVPRVPPPPPDLQAECDAGRVSSCQSLGGQRMGEGKPEDAADAFAKACNQGDVASCITAGRIRMDHGDLDGAEPPLRQGFDADNEEATLALADLHAARGDAAEAERLRWAALAVEKSLVEAVLGARLGLGGETGMMFDIHVQPMSFLARRINLGLSMSAMTHRKSELNSYVGYQHFLTSWAAPYARMFLGAGWHNNTPELNVGGEVGMKLILGEIGHLGVAFGTTSVGGSYFGIQLGLDWKLALAIALQVH
ncbi:hypothetical protein JGU66_23570 [Myxococcaceae bacterium JPH2]|nr:hypothetical protein [Myxococcaceae bacterium JPH2]